MAIAAAVRTFQAVEHRLEFVRKVGGIDFYNDSKATSVDATLKALDAFPGGLWVILGGKDKGLDYSALREPLASEGPRGAADRRGRAEDRRPVGRGGAAGGIGHAGGGRLHTAIATGSAGDTVLLAPACASFDQFRSFEHRGEVFKQIVNGLRGTELIWQTLKTDWILFVAVLAMVLFGLLIVYSASSIMAQLDPRFDSSWYFVVRQAAWAAVAVVAMMALKRTDYHKFQSPAVAFGAIGVALMLLFAVYFVDAAHHRWLRLGGPVGVQPSELAKPALVIFLAFFVTWRARAINNARHTLIPAALAVGLVIFAVVVPDLGTAVVLGAAAMVVFFVAGLRVALLLHRGRAGDAGADGLDLRGAVPAGARGAILRPRFQAHVAASTRTGWIKARMRTDPAHAQTPITSWSNRRSPWARAAWPASG